MLLCYSRRPLTILELIDAVAVELGDNPRLNPDGRFLEQEGDSTYSKCPSPIEVYTDHRMEDTARIAHSSVQEYLESKRIRQQGLANFGLRGPEC
jgi:ankyrin repeat domain-containing protein 50